MGDFGKLESVEAIGTEVVVDTRMVVAGTDQQQHMSNMAWEPYELVIEGDHLP